MLAALLKNPQAKKLTGTIEKAIGSEFQRFRSAARAASDIAEHCNGRVLLDHMGPEEFAVFERSVVGALDLERLVFLGTGRIEDHIHLLQTPLFGGFATFSEEADPKAHVDQTALFGRVLKSCIATGQTELEELLAGPILVYEEIILKSTQEKLQIVRQVEEALLKQGVAPKAVRNMTLATDELIMNALYDAPVDELGVRLLDQTARDSRILLSGKRQVRFAFAFDGKQCLLHAVDHFGSLDKQRLLNRISAVYKSGEYRVDMKSAGAGLGLGTVFRSGGSLLFRCRSGACTEATAFFTIQPSERDVRQGLRFVVTQCR